MTSRGWLTERGAIEALTTSIAAACNRGAERDWPGPDILAIQTPKLRRGISLPNRLHRRLRLHTFVLEISHIRILHIPPPDFLDVFS